MPATYTIFGTQVPVGGNAGDTAAINLGLAFTLGKVSGRTVTGARLYLQSFATQLTGYVAYLWSGSNMSTATVKKTVAFGTMTAGAWNSVNFPSAYTPVDNEVMWITVYHPNGGYTVVNNYLNNDVPSFTDQSHYLKALASASVSPSNGAYAYGASGLAVTNASTQTWYGMDAIITGPPVPPDQDLLNSRRAFYNATVANNNLSNQDMYFKFLQVKTGLTNLSTQDMAKVYWNTQAGTSGLSTQDAKRIAFGSANQFEELYWLRAQL